MAETLKVLGQVAPLAATLTDLFVVPAATKAAGSSLVICNQNAIPIAFRVAIAVAGAADAPKQYLYFDVSLLGNDTFVLTGGLSLGPTDVVRVHSDAPNVSFTLFGIEVA